MWTSLQIKIGEYKPVQNSDSTLHRQTKHYETVSVLNTEMTALENNVYFKNLRFFGLG